MDTLHYALLTGLVLLAFSLVWAGIARMKLEARSRANEQEAERLRIQIAEVITQHDAERARRESETNDWRSKCQAMEVKAAQYAEQINAAAVLHEESLAKERMIAQAEVRAAEQRMEDFRREIAARDAKRDEEMKAAFAALSSEQLGAATTQFLKLATERFTAHQQSGTAELEKRKAEVENLLKPIGDTLKRADEKLGAIENRWAGDRAGLLEQMKAIGAANENLRNETGKLVRALREPHVRGRYGEIQLKRVAQLAGMDDHCSFEIQSATVDADGNALRPDMVVRLPNDRVVVVDAKTNIRAYLEALEAETPELQDAALERFASHVAGQATALSKKKYWSAYDGSPEFVVMFIPGEQFLDAALSRRPDLLDFAASQNVLLAGPSSLIGLLRAVAVGYQEQRLAKEATALRELGKELLARAATAFEHALKVGTNLERAVKSYNDFTASYASRLEPQLRKFDESGVRSGRDVPAMPPIETRVRAVASPDRPDQHPLLDQSAP